MTDLDDIIELTHLDVPEHGSPQPTEHSGWWRVLSLCAVVAALFLTAISVVQSRDASDVPVLERSQLSLQNVVVTVDGLPTEPGSELAVLGLAASDSRRELEPGGTELGVPTAMTAVVQLTSADGSLVGLTVVPADGPRQDAAISARSTARTLVLLSPGVLRANLAEAFANLRVIEDDPAFETLVDTIMANPNLSSANEALEQAYADIADRLPAQRPETDQGCDSVVARDAYASAGTCVQPHDSGLLISNEQDRWVLVYSAGDDRAAPCATIAPTGYEGDEILIPSGQCTGMARLVAPGPVTNQGDGRQLIDLQVRAAAAVTTLYEYTGPFADLAGGSAGFNRDSIAHIRSSADEIVPSLTLLIESDDEFAAATDIARRATTAQARHVAAITATRSIIDAADTTAIIPQRAQFDDGHTTILDFFARAGDRMAASRTDWRWEADATGIADFGADT